MPFAHSMTVSHVCGLESFPHHVPRSRPDAVAVRDGRARGGVAAPRGELQAIERDGPGSDARVEQLGARGRVVLGGALEGAESGVAHSARSGLMRMRLLCGFSM
jgi:hypothetical protein